MSIHVVLEIQAVEGKVDELKAAFKKNLGDTRARSGCEGVTTHQDQDNPTTIRLLERWASCADYESNLAWRAGPGAMPELATMVTGPPSIRYFDDVDAVSAPSAGESAGEGFWGAASSEWTSDGGDARPTPTADRHMSSIELPMRTVTSGLRFPEGPIAMDDGSVLLVEIERGTLTRIGNDGAVDVVADCGGGPNGAAIGPDGKVYVCNNGGFQWVEGRGGGKMPTFQSADYQGGSIQRVDVGSGAVEVLYTHCGPHQLRGPNDLVFDASGGFWFTDPGKRRARDRDRGGLYYAQTDGSEVREVIYPLNHPNGVGLSPAGDRVYVAETETARVFSWVLSGPGEIAGYRGPETRATLLAGLGGWQWLDSLAVDGKGNVCVATIRNGGITVISPNGLDIDHVPTGDAATTNICFGGPDLRTAFITASLTGRLLETTWPRPGLRLAFG